MTNTTKKIISLVVLICFAMTQTVSANPAAGIEIATRYETPSFLQIDIPSELASLDGLFEAPPRPDPRLVLHVQNAHANYGAQMKIKELLQYLHKTYGFKTIFVEGASEDLNPDYLKMFPDRERNMRLADFLMQQGELTGAELFILEQEGGGRRAEGGNAEAPSSILHPPSEPVVQAHGIENAELYRENYEALKKVFGSEKTVSRYLGGYETRLDGLASKVFSPELRKLLGDWKKFEKGQREFMPYVHALTVDARKILGVDLESLLAQVEWPQIARLLQLQVMEKELQTEKALAEKEKLITFLTTKSVSPELLAAIKDFQGQRVSVLRGKSDSAPAGLQPRDLMEKLVLEAGPKGFRFQDYPAFSTYAGYLILKNELDPKGLFQEIRAVFARMLDTLAKTPRQRELLAIYRDEELVRKLLNLELPRREWRETVAKQQELGMDTMVERQKAIGVLVSKQSNLPLSSFETKKVSETFRQEIIGIQTAAFRFYDAARRREDVFYQKIEEVMDRDAVSKAVLVTGGFHTDGITDLLREHQVSYGILTPRLLEKSDENLYRSVMLQNKPSTFELSYLEAASKLQSLLGLEKQGVFPAEILTTILQGYIRAGDFGSLDNAIPSFNDSLGAITFGVRIERELKDGKTVYKVLHRSESRVATSSAVVVRPLAQAAGKGSGEVIPMTYDTERHWETDTENWKQSNEARIVETVQSLDIPEPTDENAPDYRRIQPYLFILLNAYVNEHFRDLRASMLSLKIHLDFKNMSKSNVEIHMSGDTQTTHQLFLSQLESVFRVGTVVKDFLGLQRKIEMPEASSEDVKTPWKLAFYYMAAFSDKNNVGKGSEGMTEPSYLGVSYQAGRSNQKSPLVRLYLKDFKLMPQEKALVDRTERLRDFIDSTLHGNQFATLLYLALEQLDFPYQGSSGAEYAAFKGMQEEMMRTFSAWEEWGAVESAILDARSNVGTGEYYLSPEKIGELERRVYRRQGEVIRLFQKLRGLFDANPRANATVSLRNETLDLRQAFEAANEIVLRMKEETPPQYYAKKISVKMNAQNENPQEGPADLRLDVRAVEEKPIRIGQVEAPVADGNQIVKPWFDLGKAVKARWWLKQALEYAVYAATFSPVVVPLIIGWDLLEAALPRTFFDKYLGGEGVSYGLAATLKLGLLAVVSSSLGMPALVNVFWFLLIDYLKVKLAWDPTGEFHAQGTPAWFKPVMVGSVYAALVVLVSSALPAPLAKAVTGLLPVDSIKDSSLFVPFQSSRQLDANLLWDFVQSQGVLRGVTPEDLQNSIAYSTQPEVVAVVQKAYARLISEGLLPEWNEFPVIFLEGIREDDLASIGAVRESFAIAPKGSEVIFVSREAWDRVASGDPQVAWVLLKAGHEARHHIDLLVDPDMSVLQTEANAYKVTARSMELAGWPKEQVVLQNQVAEAFRVLANSPEAVLEIFGVGTEFQKINYGNIGVDGSGFVRVELLDEVNGKKKMIGVDLNAPLGKQIFELVAKPAEQSSNAETHTVYVSREGLGGVLTPLTDIPSSMVLAVLGLMAAVPVRKGMRSESRDGQPLADAGKKLFEKLAQQFRFTKKESTEKPVPARAEGKTAGVTGRRGFVLSLLSAAVGVSAFNVTNVSSRMSDSENLPRQDRGGKAEAGIVADTETHVRTITLMVTDQVLESPLYADLIKSFDGDGAPVNIEMIIQGPAMKDWLLRYYETQGLAGAEKRTKFITVDTPTKDDGRPYGYARDVFAMLRNSDGTVSFFPLKSGSGEAEKKNLLAAYSSVEDGVRAVEKDSPAYSIPGGDITSDEEFIYVGQQSVSRMVSEGVAQSESAAVSMIEKFSNRKAVVLPGADIHNDRYHMPIGITKKWGRVSLLVDPVMTLELISQLTPEEKAEAEKSFVSAYPFAQKEQQQQAAMFFGLTQEQMRKKIEDARASAEIQALNNVQRVLESRGIHVVRVPGYCPANKAGFKERLGFYYVNLLQNRIPQPDGTVKRSVVYPVYGVSSLDQKMRVVLEGLSHFDSFHSVNGLLGAWNFSGPHCSAQVRGDRPRSLAQDVLKGQSKVGRSESRNAQGSVLGVGFWGALLAGLGFARKREEVRPTIPRVEGKTAGVTGPDRNTLLYLAMVSSEFKEVTGIDLTKGEHKVVDVGAGLLPINLVELAAFMRSINPKIRTAGVDVFRPAALAIDRKDPRVFMFLNDAGEIVEMATRDDRGFLHTRYVKDRIGQGINIPSWVPTEADAAAVRRGFDNVRNGKPADERWIVLVDPAGAFMASMSRVSGIAQETMQYEKGSTDSPLAANADVAFMANVTLHMGPQTERSMIEDLAKRMTSGAVIVILNGLQFETQFELWRVSEDHQVSKIDIGSRFSDLRYAYARTESTNYVLSREVGQLPDLSALRKVQEDIRGWMKDPAGGSVSEMKRSESRTKTLAVVDVKTLSAAEVRQVRAEWYAGRLHEFFDYFAIVSAVPALLTQKNLSPEILRKNLVSAKESLAAWQERIQLLKTDQGSNYSRAPNPGVTGSFMLVDANTQVFDQGYSAEDEGWLQYPRKDILNMVDRDSFVPFLEPLVRGAQEWLSQIESRINGGEVFNPKDVSKAEKYLEEFEGSVLYLFEEFRGEFEPENVAGVQTRGEGTLQVTEVGTPALPMVSENHGYWTDAISDLARQYMLTLRRRILSTERPTIVAIPGKDRYLPGAFHLLNAEGKVIGISIVEDIIFTAIDPQTNQPIENEVIKRAEGEPMRDELNATWAFEEAREPGYLRATEAGVMGDGRGFWARLKGPKKGQDFSIANPNLSAKDLFKGLVSAGERLIRLHEAGLIHGDIKPGNILFGEDQQGALDVSNAYVIDLPGVQQVGGKPEATEVLGTVCMNPLVKTKEGPVLLQGWLRTQEADVFQYVMTIVNLIHQKARQTGTNALSHDEAARLEDKYLGMIFGTLRPGHNFLRIFMKDKDKEDFAHDVYFQMPEIFGVKPLNEIPTMAELTQMLKEDLAAMEVQVAARSESRAVQPVVEKEKSVATQAVASAVEAKTPEQLESEFIKEMQSRMPKAETAIDLASVLKELSSAEQKALELKVAEVRNRLGSVDVSNDVIRVALLVGGILDLSKADLPEAKRQMMLLAATIGGQATVALRDAFKKAYEGQNIQLPVSDAVGLVVDILDAMPSSKKVEAVKGMLALNPNAHFAWIVPAGVDVSATVRDISEWGNRNGVVNIEGRLLVSGRESGLSEGIKNVTTRMRAQIYSFVVTGLKADLSKLNLESANLIERGVEIPQDVADVAGTVMSVELSQELVYGGETLSEKTNQAIKRQEGNRYKFDLDGLLSIAKSLTAQLQGLLSLEKSA